MRTGSLIYKEAHLLSLYLLQGFEGPSREGPSPSCAGLGQAEGTKAQSSTVNKNR